MSVHVYEAAVYSREVSYRNLKGQEKTVELCFALDPLQLLQVIADLDPGKAKTVKSGNPAKNGAPAEPNEGELIKLIRDLAVKAAGIASDDGESWESFEDFGGTIAGKAFLTKLTSSDADRKEFAEKVMLDPFRAFVAYATADESNSKAEVEQFQKMLAQLESVFKAEDRPAETLEERRARLRAELEAAEGLTA